MMKKWIVFLCFALSATGYFPGFACADRQVMITGANRGLGLLLTEQFVKGGDSVIAIHRGDEISEKLRELKIQHAQKVVTEKLDLTNLEAVVKLGEKYCQKGTPIDILINNAGVYTPRKPIENTFQRLNQNLSQLNESMRVNAQAPMLLSSGLLPNIASSTDKIIIFIGSAGSLFSVDEEKRQRMGFTYVVSKSALHKAIDQTASDLRDPDKCSSPEEQNVTVVGIDPGWIDTDMGKGAKGAKQPQERSAEKAAADIYRLIIGGHITLNMSGELIDVNGKQLDW